MTIRNINIAVIGLGYVGLPLLALLSQKYDCWGLDNNPKRIKDILNLKNKILIKMFILYCIFVRYNVI